MQELRPLIGEGRRFLRARNWFLRHTRTIQQEGCFMVSRRGFGKSLGMLALASAGGYEAALAQRALVGGAAPPWTIWLNANEHPDRPCPASLMAMSQVLGAS